MPWKIESRGDEFCVVKEADGELEGCHETRDEADAQLSALYAAEATTDSVNAFESLEAEKEMAMNQEKQESNTEEPTEVRESEQETKMMMGGPTSFAELEAKQEAMESAARVQDLAGMFRVMVDNIMLDPTVEDKGAAVQSLAGEFAERVDDAMTQKSLDDLVLKECHYKEVTQDTERALEADFGGGCGHCGFGDDGLSKEVRDCPHCWNTLEVAR